MSPVKTPAEKLSSQDGQQLFGFLNNQDFRKLYNKVINSCRKWHQWNAKNWFLQRLIDEKIIPSYFRVKNKNHSPTSDAATTASLEWMKNSLKDNLKVEEALGLELLEKFNTLNAVTPEHLREALKNKVTQRGDGFQKHFKEEKVARLEKFLNPKPFTPPNPPNNNKKGKRKPYIKKTKWRRMQKKLKKKSISVVYTHCP